MDRYGHLLEGAEAAAVASSADLTAMPALATGTDGMGGASVLFPNVVRAACVERARACELGADSEESPQTKNPHFTKENAGSCELVRAGRGERRARESNPQLLPATDFESAS